MLPEAIPATEEREEEVLAFFRAQGIAAPVETWERAFGPSCPPEIAAQPWLAHTHDEGITAFLLCRHGHLHLHGEHHGLRLLTGLVTGAGKAGDEGARRLLEHFTEQPGLLLAAAKTVTEIMMYRRWNWRFVAPFARMRFDPGGKGSAGKPPEPAPPDVDGDALERLLMEETAQFLPRGPVMEDYLAAPRGNPPEVWYRVEGEGGGVPAWLKLREGDSVESRRGEWVLLDIRAPLAADGDIAAALASLARATRRPVYTCFLRPTLEEACRREGATALPPRWGLFAALGRGVPALPPEALGPGEKWSLTPADVDGDLEG